MDSDELDIAIDDLETRVERLRSLYDQYFMGIEKMPPHVVHKDVERRFYALRREQIRNTGKRFKLQTIIQRYNTYQQYWMRIMREIENGTYKRHVLRAERSVGMVDAMSAAERRRLGLGAVSPGRGDSEGGEPNGSKVPGSPAAPVSADEPGPSVALDADSPRALPSRPFPSGPGHTAPRARPSLAALDDLDDPLGPSVPPPPASQPSASAINRSRQARASGNEGAATSASASEEGPQVRPLQAGTGEHPLASPQPGGLKLPVSSAVGGRGLPPPPKAGLPKVPPKINPVATTGAHPVVSSPTASGQGLKVDGVPPVHPGAPARRAPPPPADPATTFSSRPPKPPDGPAPVVSPQRPPLPRRSPMASESDIGTGERRLPPPRQHNPPPPVPATRPLPTGTGPRPIAARQSATGEQLPAAKLAEGKTAGPGRPPPPRRPPPPSPTDPKPPTK